MEISIDESQIYHMMYDDEDESDSVQGPVQEDENDSNETIQVPRPVMRSCAFCGVELEGVQLENHRVKCEEKTAKWVTLRKDPKSKNAINVRLPLNPIRNIRNMKCDFS